MKILTLALLFLLLLADASRSILRIFPEEQEVVYNYFAVVTISGQSSASIISQYNLTGKVKVQGQADHAIIQFINLNYSVFNGNSQNNEDSTNLPLPAEAATLLNPFHIHYIHGKVFKIEVDSKEPTWSTSVKKALAGILQLDLPNLNYDKHQTFTSKEDSIYGECLTMYHTEPQEDGYKITKLHSGMDCGDEPITWSNVEEASCPPSDSIKYDMISSGKKIYSVTKLNERQTLLINRLWSEGVTYTSPTHTQSNAHIITVSQLFELQDINRISTLLKIDNPQEIFSLKYDSSEFYTFKFSTEEDFNKVVAKAVGLTFLIAKELQSPQFQHFENYNPQHSHIIPLLITYLRKLDVGLLESALAEIEIRNSSSAREIFIKMLPLVGSRESSIFVANLIKKKKVQDDIALFLLSSLPFNIRQTSENILQDLEDLTNLPDHISDSVRNSAILTFATLINRICSFVNCSDQTVNKYEKQYFHYMKDSSGAYDKQLLYMAGLQNLKSKFLLDFFKNLDFGEENSMHEQLFLSAARSVYPSVASNPDKVFEVYWPVLSNYNHSLELRATVLTLLMKADLSLSKYLQLHWLMSDEPCQHLYNVFFRLIKMHADSKDDCFSSRTKIARKILMVSQKPKTVIFTTSYYKLNISSKYFLEVMTVGNLEYGFIESAYITCGNSNNIGYNYFSVYIKRNGMEGEFVKYVAQYIAAVLEDSQDNTSFLKSTASLHIELILYVNNKATTTRFYNEKNFVNFFKDIKLILNYTKQTKLSFYHVSTLFNWEKFFVTDLGMPGVLSADSPSLSAFHSDPLEDMFNIRYWSQQSTVFKVKNTIGNIWQGIIKTQVSRFNLPLSFKYVSDLQMILFKPLSDNGLFGFEWHTNTDIFTASYHDKHDALLQSCPKCKGLETMTKPNRISKVINEHKEDSFSLKTTVSNCEDDKTVNYITTFQDYYKNSPSFLGVLVSGGYFLKNCLSELPIAGSCSFAMFFAPKDKNHTSKFCVSIKDDYSSKVEESFGWKNRTMEINLGLLFGTNKQPEDEECQFRFRPAELIVEEYFEEKNSDGNQDTCFIDGCTQFNDNNQLFGKLLNISASISQIPEDIQTFILDLINQLKRNSNLYLSPEMKPVSASSGLRAELVLDCRDGIYFLDFSISSNKLISKQISYDTCSNIIKFLKGVLYIKNICN